jgi:hypothetical protein
VILGLTVVGIPIVIWLAVRWLFVAQATMLEARRGRAALARSAQLVRRRWWHTALLAVIVAVVISTVGLVVGLVCLIVFTGLPMWALSAIVVLVDLLVMPYGALVITYLYGDALAATMVAAVEVVDAEPTLA